MKAAGDGEHRIKHLHAWLFGGMLLLGALGAGPMHAMRMEEDGCRNDQTPGIVVYCTDRLVRQGLLPIGPA